ncbi:hypothetical protein Rhal01_00334 [Rubritalea halochordaticola]|uniref:DUF304 domain-containing protein n=2 Tax=Rubritalea halochordaticola TaxID=714537 RepID=A0ABP9UUM2_9BACT
MIQFDIELRDKHAHKNQVSNKTTEQTSKNMLSKLVGSGTKSIAEPEKELRFTRARQATMFFFATAVFFMLTIGTLFCGFLNLGWNDYYFQKNWWLSFLFLIPAFICLRIAFRCIRHAYIILTPLGIEIFPFFKPQADLQVIFWQDIDSAEIEDNNLILHSNQEKTAGVVVTLNPISETKIPLLKKAVTSRLAN